MNVIIKQHSRGQSPRIYHPNRKRTAEVENSHHPRLRWSEKKNVAVYRSKTDVQHTDSKATITKRRRILLASFCPTGGEPTACTFAKLILRYRRRRASETGKNENHANFLAVFEPNCILTCFKAAPAATFSFSSGICIFSKLSKHLCKVPTYVCFKQRNEFVKRSAISLLNFTSTNRWTSSVVRNDSQVISIGTLEVLGTSSSKPKISLSMQQIIDTFSLLDGPKCHCPYTKLVRRRVIFAQGTNDSF